MEGRGTRDGVLLPQASLAVVRRLLGPGTTKTFAKAEASIARGTRKRSWLLCAKDCRRPLLRSSAHSLWAPATWET